MPGNNLGAHLAIHRVASDEPILMAERRQHILRDVRRLADRLFGCYCYAAHETAAPERRKADVAAAMCATKTPAALWKRWPGNAIRLLVAKWYLNIEPYLRQRRKTVQPPPRANADRIEYAGADALPRMKKSST